MEADQNVTPSPIHQTLSYFCPFLGVRFADVLQRYGLHQPDPYPNTDGNETWA
jgi:hypothetical protein